MEDNYKCDKEILLQWMFGMVDQNSQKIELADLFILGTCLCRAKEAIKIFICSQCWTKSLLTIYA